ncbi:MAG: protein-serine/threonine phosphatase [Burkholderiaceae bacterium]|nr:protein-serine/threonine phosphatase [Burkholderiaceae bacterium]
MTLGNTLMSAASRLFRQPQASDLCVATPSIAAERNNATVLEIFSKHRELISLPVLENDRPIGLISRNIFMSQMSRPFQREIYDKKSCIAFMDKDPLIVDADTGVEQIAEMAVQMGDKTLADGFVIVKDGKLMGLASGLELMRVVVELQAEKNRHVMQSIEYASVIQRAMLSTSHEAMAGELDDAFLVWEPRDLVGGDFYHFERLGDGWFAAVADCTGHGVPGAFLTLIASSALKQAIDRHGARDPAKLLEEVNRSIKHALGQNDGDSRWSESDEGMDAVFMCYDATMRKLTFAGAKLPLFVLVPDEPGVKMVDGERIGLGYVNTPEDAAWTSKILSLPEGAIVIATTDGFTDQIGGLKNISYGKRRLRDSIIAQRQLPMKAFADVLMDEFKAYQGQQMRRDDVTLFGFRVK